MAILIKKKGGFGFIGNPSLSGVVSTAAGQDSLSAGTVTSTGCNTSTALPNDPTITGTNYAKHLGVTAVTGSVNLQTYQANTAGALKNVTTEVAVNKGVVDGGCKVGCSGARTVNLGNYESVKISVWLEMPCAKDDIASTYDFITDWVGEQLTAAVKQAKE